MNNREFAQVLLSEATELLTETSARMKYEKTLGNRQDKIKSDKKENLKRLENEPDKRNLFGKNKAKSYIDTAKMILEDKKLESENNAIKKEARKYSERVYGSNINRSLDNDYAMHANKPDKKFIEKDRKAKKRFMKDFGGKKPKNSKLHERINARGEKFKSQHECIAVLLTEAALLLNDED